jgi:hypothetical protein
MPEQELEIGEQTEIEPGVVVERRSLFKTLGVALALLSLPRLEAANANEIANSELSFAEFLALANPIAKTLVADTSILGQDRYLLTLASFAVRLTNVAAPEMRDSGQGAGPGTFIGFNPGGDPFTVLHWKMNPNTTIRTHAHTYGNVVTLGLEGDARIENYEMVGAKAFKPDVPFSVRRTREQWLTRGGVNLVNLDRDYIHGITAGPNGARGLDITTRIRPKETAPYLIFTSKSDEGSSVREAKWSIG